MRLLRILFWSAIILGMAFYFYGKDHVHSSSHKHKKHKHVSKSMIYSKVESYQDTPFDAIDISCNCKVYLEKGDTWKVRFKGEHSANTPEDYVKGGTLHLRDNHSLLGNDDTKIYITTPGLNKISIGGTATLEGKESFRTEELSIHIGGATEVELNIDVAQLEVYLGGASELELSGTATQASYAINGAGEFEGYNLRSENVSLEISGAGDAEVNVSQYLDAKVLGAGEVSYRGNPHHVSQHISGVGSIRSN